MKLLKKKIDREKAKKREGGRALKHNVETTPPDDTDTHKSIYKQIENSHDQRQKDKYLTATISAIHMLLLLFHLMLSTDARRL